VVALLAHEAALAIHRADEISALAGMATTDPLTGLPNRRAWDERLSRAVGENQPVTIAMLDLDHFKDFNDANGHPAGDRLLKETSAAWRDVLRAGDMVARLGGEEFGLLLFDCELDAAIEVTERLRELVTHGQTCSVGLAVRHPGEGVDTVMARVDRALYDAKSAGRDRASCAEHPAVPVVDGGPRSHHEWAAIIGGAPSWAGRAGRAGVPICAGRSSDRRPAMLPRRQR
jgi:diguanylate cyclase (GGDEF)-like protein